MKIFVFLLAFAGAMVTHASENLPPQQDKMFRQWLMQMQPGASIERVFATPLPDWYGASVSNGRGTAIEVFHKDKRVIGNQGLYQTGNGQIQRMTEADALHLRSQVFAELKSLGILGETRYGDGRRQVLLISAPDCGYCKRLEGFLQRNAASFNATLYYLPLYLDSSRKVEVKGLWCAGGNRQAVLRDAMNGTPPRYTGNCAYSMDDSEALAALLTDYNVTPIAVLPDGRGLAIGGWSETQLMELFGARASSR